MKTLNPYVNPEIGGYEIVGNQLLNVPSAIVKANMLLKQQIGADIYNPNNGNPLLTLDRLPTRKEVVNGIGYCLQPLTNSGELVSVKIATYSVNVFNRANILIEITLPSGNTANITWKQ